MNPFRVVSRLCITSGIVASVFLTAGCGPAWVSPPSPMYPPGHRPQPGMNPTIPVPPKSDLGESAEPPPTFDNEDLPGNFQDLPEVPADQVLQLPPSPRTPQFYDVKPGDTLTSIADMFGVTVEQLRAANGIEGNDIKVRELLQIPRGSR